MHDRNGTPLKLGDIVTMKMEVISVSPDAEYCNVTGRSVDGRKPDGTQEVWTGNTSVLVLQEAS